MSDLLTLLSHGPDLAGVVIGVAIGMRAVASIMCAWIEQRGLTNRLNKALEGTKPSQRAKLIDSVVNGGRNGTEKHGSD
jgi:hypothetical protein